MNRAFLKIVAVHLRPRDNDRDTLRHELHNLGAVRFVSKRIGALGHYSKVRIGDHLRHFIEWNTAVELDTFLKTEPLYQISQRDFHVPACSRIDVELRLWNLALELGKGLDCYIQSLVPLQASWKQDNKLAVSSRSRMPGKHFRVDVIDQNGAPLFWNRARNHSLIPEVVRDNHMVDKFCRHFFDFF